jgi:hypothetical protein
MYDYMEKEKTWIETTKPMFRCQTHNTTFRFLDAAEEHIREHQSTVVIAYGSSSANGGRGGMQPRCRIEIVMMSHIFEG